MQTLVVVTPNHNQIMTISMELFCSFECKIDYADYHADKIKYKSLPKNVNSIMFCQCKCIKTQNGA